MNPSLYEILPWLAALAFIVASLMQASGRPAMRGAWAPPAALAILLLSWSLLTVAREGVSAVWIEHTRNAWGNQIWFDLLMAAGLSLVLLFPRARAVGMHPVRWLVLVACSGSIGLFAMLARCLFLEERERRARGGSPKAIPESTTVAASEA